jgi:hypothetical protein
MRLLSASLLPAIFSPLLAAPLHAQVVELYGTFTGLHSTNVPTDQFGIPANFGAAYLTTRYDFNFVGGGTFNVLSGGPLKLGVDVRGTRRNFLTGARLTVHPPVFRIAPYVQGSLGYLNVPENGVNNRYAVAEVFAGIDVPTLPHLDYRLIEIGAGHAINAANGSQPSFVSVSAGLVVHF